MRNFSFRKSLFFFVAIGVWLIAAQAAQANVTVTPTIVLIEGRDRFAEVNLINTADKPETYEIKWTFNKMLETSGNYYGMEASLTDFDLSKHLIFSPKRVTVEGKGAQKIRLALRLNGDPPPPGDYRAHLLFKQIRSAPSPSSAPIEKGKSSVAVHVNVSYSIPVIYRVGEGNAGGKIGTVRLDRAKKTGQLNAIVPITRTGKGPYGVLGHLQIYYVPTTGKEELIGEIKNGNIYPEVTLREFKAPLSKKELGPGVLNIIYRDFSRAKKPVIYDQLSVPVGR